MRKILVSGALLLGIVVSLGLAANAQRILGGYNPVATDNPRAVEAAEFAVSKRSEEQEGLKLESIEKAEMQSVAGVNFRLCMTVSLDDNTQQVKTVVNKNLQSVYSLISWEVVDSCDGSGTGAKGSKSAAIHKKTSPHCSGEQLTLAEVDAEADIGGKRYGNYVFTNTSSKPCSLFGYPTFVLLNRSGRVFRGIGVEYTNDYPNSETQENGKKSASVTLEPGKKAWFQIYYNDGMALDHKKPYPVSYKVRITATNDKRKFVLKSKIQACCGVQVSSIREGSPQ